MEQKWSQLSSTAVDGNIEVNYEATVWLGEGNDFQTDEEAYSKTTTLLNQSVVDGNFTNVMNSYAADESCVALMNAMAYKPPEVDGYLEVTSTSSRGNDDEFEIDLIFLITLICPSIVIIAIGVIAYRRLLNTGNESAANDKLFKSSLTNRSESVSPMTRRNDLSERLLA